MIRPVDGLLLALVLSPVTFASQDPAFADTHVRSAFRLHISQDELKHLANAFGEEISKQKIVGGYGGTASDDLGFTQVSAQGITFSAKVAHVDSLIEEGTGQDESALATKVTLGSFTMHIDTLHLNESGSIHCNDLTITATAPLKLSMDLVPVIDDQVLFMNPANIVFDDETDEFQATSPASCQTPWGFSWLVKQIAPWIAGKLRVQLASAVASEIVQEIGRQTTQVSEESNVRFALPWPLNPAPVISASAQIWPDNAVLRSQGPARERTFTVDFGTRIVVEAEGRESAVQENKGLPGSATWNGWIGASKDLIAGIISEAARAELLSFTLSRQTAPGLQKLLSARQLARFVPDAATRFQGNEDVEIRVGQAEAASVIFKPNGPGGIPIIDAVLQKVPLEVHVDGAPYFTTSSTMRFSYLTAADSAGGRLLFNFSESAHTVHGIVWSPDLYPRPSDQTITSEGFSSWLGGIADNPKTKAARTFGIALPEIHIGSYRIKWLEAVSIREGYLAVAAAIR